ncbi:MAG: hypothetical protein VSS75_006205, partial [Candidatus Parabeggiatoa sp.]|nr:hypothetical protein [Candidatus Parabeggiatoa sp.]
KRRKNLLVKIKQSVAILILLTVSVVMFSWHSSLQADVLDDLFKLDKLLFDTLSTENANTKQQFQSDAERQLKRILSSATQARQYEGLYASADLRSPLIPYMGLFSPRQGIQDEKQLEIAELLMRQIGEMVNAHIRLKGTDQNAFRAIAKSKLIPVGNKRALTGISNSLFDMMLRYGERTQSPHTTLTRLTYNERIISQIITLRKGELAIFEMIANVRTKTFDWRPVHFKMAVEQRFGNFEARYGLNALLLVVEGQNIAQTLRNRSTIEFLQMLGGHNRHHMVLMMLEQNQQQPLGNNIVVNQQDYEGEFGRLVEQRQLLENELNNCRYNSYRVTNCIIPTKQKIYDVNIEIAYLEGLNNRHRTPIQQQEKIDSKWSALEQQKTNLEEELEACEPKHFTKCIIPTKDRINEIEVQIARIQGLATNEATVQQRHTKSNSIVAPQLKSHFDNAYVGVSRLGRERVMVVDLLKQEIIHEWHSISVLNEQPVIHFLYKLKQVVEKRF